jgi:hypothetical protein
VSESTLQWGRVCQVITGAGGRGLLVDDLRITFEITKTLLRSPNTADVKIYNLHPDNEAKIKGEFDEVLVNAGYKNATQLLFRGNIRHTFRYRDGNDWITQIDAADGDRDFRHARMVVALAGGSTAHDLISKAVASFKTTSLGHFVAPAAKRIRGAVYAGPTREVLDRLAATLGSNWSIQDGSLDIVSADSTLPTKAIVINADTGMLGAPEIDDKGITVKCLLNPAIVPNGKIWLDNNDIQLRVKRQREAAPGAKKPSAKTKQTEIARLDPDGVYKVYRVTHKGDTRGTGNDWVSEVHCVGLGKAIPPEARAA